MTAVSPLKGQCVMYRAESDGKGALEGFADIFKGSAIASAGGIVLIIVLLLISAAVMNAAVPDPDSFIYAFLLASVSAGSCAAGYASVVLSRAGLSSALLSAALITVLSSALALLFGGGLSFGRHLIMIICVCAFSCAGGFIKTRGKGVKKHRAKMKRPVKKPAKR